TTKVNVTAMTMVLFRAFMVGLLAFVRFGVCSHLSQAAPAERNYKPRATSLDVRGSRKLDERARQRRGFAPSRPFPGGATVDPPTTVQQDRHMGPAIALGVRGGTRTNRRSRPRRSPACCRSGRCSRRAQGRIRTDLAGCGSRGSPRTCPPE